MDRRLPPTEQVIAETRCWLERAVIGLNLCPFAKAVHVKGAIRWVVSPATTPQELLEALADELTTLQASDPVAVETTLLIHPGVLGEFVDYLWFIELADRVLEQLGLSGEVQIAHFHPQFCFEGSREDDVANCSNRSPWPILHLLRESSVDRAVAAFPDAAVIYQRNIDTLRALGPAGWAALWQRDGPPAPTPIP